MRLCETPLHTLHLLLLAAGRCERDKDFDTNQYDETCLEVTLQLRNRAEGRPNLTRHKALLDDEQTGPREIAVDGRRRLGDTLCAVT